jgi:hypothetical protein
MCCGSFMAVTYFTVSKVIQSSGAYAQAIAEVNTDPQVEAELGVPVKGGFGISGNLNEKNGIGEADFSVPIEGKKGKGELHVVGTGKDNVWTFTTIEVTAKGKTIDVLKNAQPEDKPDVPPEEEEEPQDPEPDGD